MIFFRNPAKDANREVTVDDARMISVFKESYKRGETLSQILDMLMESEEEFTFDNARDLQRYIQRDYIGNIHLNLDVAPVFPGTPVSIIMQGNRTADFQVADEKLEARLGHLPNHDGYTWHHKEGIVQRGGRWECDMYLVESNYHRRHPHKGGVFEYTLYTGRAYT